LGRVLIDLAEIGTFSPQEVGASGNVSMDAIVIGSFTLDEATGNVYLNTTIIGTYEVPAVKPPIPPEEAIVDMFSMMINMMMFVFVVGVMSRIIREMRRRD